MPFIELPNDTLSGSLGRITGQGVGGGVSSLLEGLAESKLKSLNQKQKRQDLRSAFPELEEEKLDFLSRQPDELILKYLQTIPPKQQEKPFGLDQVTDEQKEQIKQFISSPDALKHLTEDEIAKLQQYLNPQGQQAQGSTQPQEKPFSLDDVTPEQMSQIKQFISSPEASQQLQPNQLASLQNYVTDFENRNKSTNVPGSTIPGLNTLMKAGDGFAKEPSGGQETQMMPQVGRGTQGAAAPTAQGATPTKSRGTILRNPEREFKEEQRDIARQNLDISRERLELAKQDSTMKLSKPDEEYIIDVQNKGQVADEIEPLLASIKTSLDKGPYDKQKNPEGYETGLWQVYAPTSLKKNATTQNLANDISALIVKQSQLESQGRGSDLLRKLIAESKISLGATPESILHAYHRLESENNNQRLKWMALQDVNDSYEGRRLQNVSRKVDQRVNELKKNKGSERFFRDEAGQRWKMVNGEPVRAENE